MGYDFTSLKAFLPQYVSETLTASRERGKYNCPLCGSGTGHNATAAFSVKGELWTCFSCNESGDLIDLYKAMQGVDTGQAAEELSRKFGVLVPDRDHTKKPVEKNHVKPQEQADFTSWIASCRRTQISDYPIAVQYLREHGATPEQAQEHGVVMWDSIKSGQAWDNGWGAPPHSPALIFTYPGGNYWHARQLSPQAPRPWNKPREGVAGRDPLMCVTPEEEAPLYVVEGLGDFLALAVQGKNVLSLSGTSGVVRGADLIKESSLHVGTIVEALDKDEPGRKAAANLAERLQDNIMVSLWKVVADLEDVKDPAQLAAQYPQELHKALEAFSDPQKMWQLKSIGAGLEAFIDRVKNQDPNEITSTGIQGIDDALDGGIYPGLYVLGAVSSLGKTTLALQIADNISSAGDRDVIVVSLEQGTDELVAKSLSRLTRLKAGNDLGALTSRSIGSYVRWKNHSPEQTINLRNSIETYREQAQNLYIIEGIGDLGVEKIRHDVERHIKATGRIPFVVIDYLQILAPTDPRLTDKANIDKAITELKRLSRDTGAPILAISSLNRASYSAPVSMESFKESGAIEYGCDVLLGLQVAGLEMDEKKAAGNKTKTANQRSLATRDMELVVLKNRNGATGRKVPLKFQAAFSLFSIPAYGAPTVARY